MKRLWCIVAGALLLATGLTVSTWAQAAAGGQVKTFTLFIDHSWYWVDSFGGRPVDDMITAKTGVAFKVTKAADNNQLPLMIASGDLTDFVYASRLWNELGNSNVSYAWNDLIKKYAPDFKIPAIEIGNTTMPDGNFYTIRNAWATPEEWKDPRVLPSPGRLGLAVRQDIMDKIGNPPINNMNDFRKVLTMVKARFPDLVPHILDMSEQATRYYYELFGLPVGGTNVYAENGVVKYRIRHPKFVQALKFLNALYRDGFIPAESLVYKDQEGLGALATGKVFSFVRTVTDPSVVNERFKKAGVTGEMRLIPQILSDTAVYINDSVGWSGLFVTKKNSDPKTAINFVKFMKSEEGQRLASWGIQEQHYTLTADGYPVLTKSMAEMKKNYGDMVRKVGVNAWGFLVSARTEGVWNYNPTQDPVVTQALQNAKKIQVFKPEYNFLLLPGGSDERVTYDSVWKLLYPDEEVRLIASASEAAFDKEYTDFIKKAEAMGLVKLEDYMTKKHAEVIKNYQ